MYTVTKSIDEREKRKYFMTKPLFRVVPPRKNMAIMSIRKQIKARNAKAQLGR
jgi:hypothetical protein